MRYNIYAGLGGSFGGATYQGTGDFNSIESAEEMAYQCAVEEYEITEMYNDEKESWMEYYVRLTEEDDLEDEEITGL